MLNPFGKIAQRVFLIALGFCFSSAFAIDACKDEMGHVGSAHTVSGNQTGSISGTAWGFEQWYQGGNNSMTYYDNGTFKANWSGSSDYLARVGFRYGDNGPGVDHTTKQYTVDYRYTKSGSASYGYIGVYGWTVNPQVEYYIVDDWYSKPSENYVGEKFGEITVDGATYTIHAYLRQQEPSKSGTSTFVQIFSIRKTPRQCGHIDISAHFKKWDELFTGQTAQLKGSKGGGSATLKFGKVTEVMLMNEAGGNASGTVDYTYFNMTDNGTGSVVIPEDSTAEIERRPFNGVKAKIPGTIEAEDFDEGNNGVSYNDNSEAIEEGVLTDYRGEDYFADVVGTGSGYAIGYTAQGEWLEYTVDVEADAEYTVEALVSNGSGDGSISLSIGEATGKIDFSATEDWNTYQTASTKMYLKKGEHILRVTFDTDNTNLDNLTFTADGQTGMAAPLKWKPVSGTFFVFDMQGRLLGKVWGMEGSSLDNALRSRFQNMGTYLVKQENWVKIIRVE